MTDKSRDNGDQSREDAHDAVQAHTLDFSSDALRNGVQEPRTIHSFAERETAGREDDDGPEEIIEIFFRQYSRAEEEDDGDDGYDAHIAKDSFELVAETPEQNCNDGDDGDEPLNSGELVFHRADRDDGRVAAGAESDEQQYPDEQDGDDADGQGDEEPDAPAGLRGHVL